MTRRVLWVAATAWAASSGAFATFATFAEYPTMCGTIRQRGFECEEHNVTTADGYILRMFRIPGPGPAVLVQHGLLDSSFTWCLNDRNQSLAYVLRDQGLDVWLGNNRGNEFGLGHTTLSYKKKPFWQFTYDEMAAYDLPAMVDKVLETTGTKTLSYIGHSQGTMQAWAGFSISPDLQSKVERFYALAPIADIYHSESPVVNLLATFGNALLGVLSHFDHSQFMPSKSLLNYLSSGFCHLFPYGCDVSMYTITGPNRDVDATRLDGYVKVTPSGTSDKNMAHFVQNKKHKGFARYNGPAYDLGAITVPSVIVSGMADVLSDPKDVNWLVSQLKPETVARFDVVSGYAHLDFTWGIHANERVYTPFIIDDMRRIGILPATAA